MFLLRFPYMFLLWLWIFGMLLRSTQGASGSSRDPWCEIVLVEPNQRGSLEHPLNLTLPEFNIAAIAPENRPTPKRKGSSSNHPFSGAFDVSFREGIVVVEGVGGSKGMGVFPTCFLKVPPTHRLRMDILKDSPLGFRMEPTHQSPTNLQQLRRGECMWMSYLGTDRPWENSGSWSVLI